MEKEISLARRIIEWAPGIGTAFLLGTYLMAGIRTGTWTPKQYTEMVKRIKQTNSSYDKLLENAANFDDSLKFYIENGLPIKLEEPSLEQKEKIVKQNDLEKDLSDTNKEEVIKEDSTTINAENVKSLYEGKDYPYWDYFTR